MEVLNKICLSCGKTVRGRSDKKFCDDNCRNSYNNQLKALDNNYVRNVNNALKKNRRVLTSFLSNGETMIEATKDKLLQQGFQFEYLTHTHTTGKGHTYVFCYDYGYLPLDNDCFLIVKRTEALSYPN